MMGLVERTASHNHDTIASRDVFSVIISFSSDYFYLPVTQIGTAGGLSSTKDTVSLFHRHRQLQT